MVGYLVRRLISALLVLIATSAIVFAVFFYGPADPAQSLCQAPNCTEERIQRIREAIGMDKGGLESYGEYMKGIVAGRDIEFGSLKVDCDAPCLGVSFRLREDVADYLMERFPATLSIALGSSVFILAFGVPVGILAARRRGTAADKLIVGSSLVLNAAPYFVLCLLVQLYFVAKFGIFPSPEYVSVFDNPVSWASGLILVWLTIGITSAPIYARYARGSMVETLNEDYIRSARAKGLGDRRVTYKHAVRAAMTPVVTIYGLEMATLLGGTIITEAIFSIDGIGAAAIEAIGSNDLPVISATALIAAVFIVMMNIVVDLLYTVLDPRVRL